MGFGGSHVHGQIFADLGLALEVNQNPDTATVYVAGQLILGFETSETANRHVFAHFTYQRSAGAFNGTLAHWQFCQGSHVGGIFLGDQLGNAIDKADEIFVLGYKIGFAIDFENGAGFGVRRNMQTDQAFGSHARSGFAGLAAQFDTQNFFCTLHIATCFGEGFFAFHHGGVGFFP